MRTPINSACVLPFYTDITQQVRSAHDGFGIVASSTKLIPFTFDEDEPAAVSEFHLIEINGARTYKIPDLLMAVEVDTDGKAVYYFDGDNLKFTVICGQYFIKASIKNGDRVYYSAILNVQNICSAENVEVGYIGEVNNQHRFSISPLMSSPQLETVGTYENGQITVSVATPTHFDTALIGIGETSTIIRKVKTDCSLIDARYFFKRTSAGVGEIHLFSRAYSIDEPSEGIWYLEYSHDKDVERIPYSSGYKQRFYCKPVFASPSPDENNSYLPNGDGKEYLEQAILKGQLVITIPDVPDGAIEPLKFAMRHKYKKLVNTVTGLEIELDKAEISFDNAADQYMNVAQIITPRKTLIIRSYMENMGLRGAGELET